MRFKKRKPMEVCQNCKYGNNDRGKWIHTWKRKDLYKGVHKPYIKGFWHIFCEKRNKFYPWDYKKKCFKEYS